MSTKLLFTVKEVSEMLNLGKSTVYDYARAGFIKPIYLPSVKASTAVKHNKKAIRFTVASVQEFLHTLGVVNGFDVKEVP
jgi:hypothetical protein